jgi:hypothetical protein
MQNRRRQPRRAAFVGMVADFGGQRVARATPPAVPFVERLKTYGDILARSAVERCSMLLPCDLW